VIKTTWTWKDIAGLVLVWPALVLVLYVLFEWVFPALFSGDSGYGCDMVGSCSYPSHP